MGNIAGLEVGLPRGIAEVDAAWLTTVLRTSAAIDSATSLATVEIEPFAVGAGLLSLLYRVSPTYDGGSGPDTTNDPCSARPSTIAEAVKVSAVALVTSAGATETLICPFASVTPAVAPS